MRHVSVGVLLAASALFATGVIVGMHASSHRIVGILRDNASAGASAVTTAVSSPTVRAPAPAPEVPLPAPRLAGSSLFANHGKDVLSSWARPASAHVCSGGTPIEVFHGADHTAPQRFMAPEKRSCVFRNLCWNGGEFVYFRDPAHPLPFEYSNAAGPQFAPPSPLLALGQMLDKYEYRDWISLSMVDGPIPASYSMADGVGADGEPTVHLLVASSSMNNIGHELADSVWPAFGTLLETRMLALDNQVVVMEKGAEPYGSFASLSQRPPVKLGAIPAQTCFPWAVAGNGGRGLPSPPLPSLFSWSAMQSFVFQRYGLPHGALEVPVRAHAAAAAAAARVPADASPADGLRIVIRHKTGRHTFTNFDELVGELRRCYPSADVALVDPETLSFEEELRLIANATVYITPGGGGSFTAPFLSRNAILIIAAACWPGTAAGLGADTAVGLGIDKNNPCQAPSPAGVCCMQVERHVWSNWQYIHTEYLTYLGPVDAMRRDPAATHENFEALSWNYPANPATVMEIIDRRLFVSRGIAASNCTPPSGK